jgi:hypothetical protein
MNESTQPWNTTASQGYPSPQVANMNNYAKQAEPLTSSQARDRISSAEQWLSDLNNIVDGLEKRLDTILTPVPPSGVGNAASPTPTQPKSHVVGRLDILCEGYSHLASRIQHLSNRIEL